MFRAISGWGRPAFGLALLAAATIAPAGAQEAAAPAPTPAPKPAAHKAAAPKPAAHKPPAHKPAAAAKPAAPAPVAAGPAAPVPDAVPEPESPAPAAPKPAAPGPITPAQLAAARDLVVASGMSRSFSVVIPQFIDQIGGSLTQTRPELIEDLKAVFASLRPEFDKQADQMTDIAAQIFAKRLGEADLKASNAFFASAAGKAYVAAQPAILTDIVTAMQGWQGKLSTDMMTRVREEMKKKGHEI